MHTLSTSSAAPRRLAFAGACGLLVLLLFVPLDLITTVLWLGGGLVALMAARHLWQQRRPPRSSRRIVGSLALLALWTADCANCAGSWRQAMSSVWRTARAADVACKRDGRCPSFAQLCPGAPKSGTCTSAGSGGISFDIHYVVDESGMAFRVGARLSIDHFYNVRGGVDRPLTSSGSTD
jgi:hypothetical protein